MPIKHEHQTSRADSYDADAVQPSHWNSDHVITGLLAMVDSLAPQPKTVFALDSANKPALKPLSDFIADRLGDVDAQTFLQALGAAPLQSPAFTNSPTAPTAAPGTNTQQIATTAWVRANAPVNTASKATLALTFDTYRTTYDIACLGSMTTHNLPGTFFIVPEKIDAAAGAQTLTSDELAIMQAKGWEIDAYSSNVGQTQNMQQIYTADRKSVGLRFKAIYDAMVAKGIRPHGIAAMQRAWYAQMNEVARPWFKFVRVADQYDLGVYPLADDHCFLSHGGGSASWSSADTLASLLATLDAVIASKGFWMPVIHQIGAVADAYTVSQSIFDAFIAAARDRVNAGILRVTTMSQALAAAA